MRKLASIRKIDSIEPIDNADAIEVATLGGWKVVVKKAEFQAGDLAVYCEVDSWIPHELAPFLSKGKEPRVYEGVKGERLRTIRLRGQLSQGLLLPINVLAVKTNSGNYLGDWDQFEGYDVSERLGIIKWEAPEPAQLAGNARGNFPSAVRKTDQERVQNIQSKEFEDFCNLTWEVTEKLHGSSCTFYMDAEDEFHVCSRNLDLKRDENNAFWKIAIKYEIEEKIRRAGLRNIAFQGELIGEGINGNQYQTTLDFYVFDIFETEHQSYCPSNIRQIICENLKLKHCPVLTNYTFKDNESIQSLLELAAGKSKLNGSDREGLVFKDTTGKHSFKVISNSWLLKNDA
jgi:RNA ligase (TIGR02306 family)